MNTVIIWSSLVNSKGYSLIMRFQNINRIGKSLYFTFLEFDHFSNVPHTFYAESWAVLKSKLGNEIWKYSIECGVMVWFVRFVFGVSWISLFYPIS